MMFARMKAVIRGTMVSVGVKQSVRILSALLGANLAQNLCCRPVLADFAIDTLYTTENVEKEPVNVQG